MRVLLDITVDEYRVWLQAQPADSVVGRYDDPTSDFSCDPLVIGCIYELSGEMLGYVRVTAQGVAVFHWWSSGAESALAVELPAWTLPLVAHYLSGTPGQPIQRDEALADLEQALVELPSVLSAIERFQQP